MKKYTTWMLLLIAILLVTIGGLLAYLIWGRSDDTPSQTVSSDTASSHSVENRSFTSAKGVKIEIDNWPKSGVISSPLTITGKVPGSWAYEGSFPIDVVYEGDIGLPGTTAKLQGDWMTDAMVPFTATLTFDARTMASDDVGIVLRNANPSGLPENDDSLSLKVYFSK